MIEECVVLKIVLNIGDFALNVILQDEEVPFEIAGLFHAALEAVLEAVQIPLEATKAIFEFRDVILQLNKGIFL